MRNWKNNVWHHSESILSSLVVGTYPALHEDFALVTIPLPSSMFNVIFTALGASFFLCLRKQRAFTKHDPRSSSFTKTLCI